MTPDNRHPSDTHHDGDPSVRLSPYFYKKRNQNAAKRAAKLFHRVCVVCGTEHALQIAHIDRNRANNDPDNLVYLCATHHAMQDVGLYADDVIKALRHDWDQHKGQPDHALRMKDAGRKAAATRLRNRTIENPVLQEMYELSPAGGRA